MLPASNRLPMLNRARPNGRMRFVMLWSIAISLMVSAIVLAACQPAPRPTPQVLTATPLPYTVTPAPSSLPVHSPISLDTPGRAAIRVVNALASSSGGAQSAPLDVYLDGSPIVIRLAPDLPSAALGYQPGHFQLRVFTSNDQSLKLSQPLDLTAAQSVVVVLTGSLDKITATVLINITDGIPAGQIRLSLAHFQSGSGAVNVSATSADGQSSLLTTLTTAGTVTAAPLQPLTVHAIKFEQGGHEPQMVALSPVDRTAYLVIWLPSGTVIVINDDTPRTAQVRLIDANSALGAVDLRLSSPGITDRNQPFNGTLNFGQSRPWQTVPIGHYTLGVFDTGAAADARPRFSVEIDLLADSHQNIILFGTADKPQISTISEDLSPLTADSANKARLTIVNAAPGARGLVTLLSGSVVDGLPPAEYGQTSGPLVIHPGPLSLGFHASSDNPGTPQAVEYKAPFDVLPNSAYLYVVTGTASNIPPAVFVTTLPVSAVAPANSTAANVTTVPGTGLRVRLINALGDGTAVDLTLNSKPLFQAVNTGTGTAYQSYVPQTSTWVVHVAGQTTALSSVDLAPISSGSITLLVIGKASSARLEQSVDKLPSGAGASSALLDIIHAATGLGAIRADRPFSLPTALPVPTADAGVTLGAITATPIGQVPPSAQNGSRSAPAPQLVDHLAYGELSPVLSLSPDTYTVAIHDAATNRLLAQIPDTIFATGKRYDVLLLPMSGGKGDVRLALIVSNIDDSGNQ